MIFRQLFEPISSTYTYLLGCETTGQAVLVDAVVNSIDRDLEVLQSLGLRLSFTLDTHIHADHITAARHLRERVGSKIAGPAVDALPCTDVGVFEGVPFRVGSITIEGLTLAFRQSTDERGFCAIGSVKSNVGHLVCDGILNDARQCRPNGVSHVHGGCIIEP